MVHRDRIPIPPPPPFTYSGGNRYLPMLGHTFPGVKFPGKVPVYRMGPSFFAMRDFFDANIDRFPIFVYENLNEEVPAPRPPALALPFPSDSSVSVVAGHYLGAGLRAVEARLCAGDQAQGDTA